MLCEFNLPSNPEIKVRLREATVAEAIDFSSIDPDCEEEATSLFLEKVQEKETYSDPRAWTGEDRRYALFMYYVHTSDYKTIPLTYTCSICGKQHTQDISLASILENYTPMDGSPFRDFPHDGHNVVIHPLTGADLEDIEKYRYDLLLTEQLLEKNRDNLPSADIKRLEADLRAKRVRMAMLRVICCIDMPYLDEQGTPRSRRGAVETKIKAMPAGEFREFMRRVENALVEMRHGLSTEYVNGRIVLLIPDVRCDEHPELPGVLLRYPFRFGQVVPTI
ncbi:MAG: hypothetical protein J5960_09605 [Desulfovibrio sp.]|nr:hypothetical protein [Desulfovibrio sp.]